MSANHFPIHPAADLFPMLDSTGMQALAADIAASGLRTPVALWNGQVIDGRNRLEACRIATVEPRCETMQFADNAECVRYIVSTNLHRRHLTDEQRDQIGARLVTMGQGGDRANPQNAGLIGVDAAAGLVSSTPARIERARTIERADPELAAQVRAGTITKGGALKQIRERAKVQTDPDQAADSVVDATATGNSMVDVLTETTVIDFPPPVKRTKKQQEKHLRAVADYEQRHQLMADASKLMQRLTADDRTTLIEFLFRVMGCKYDAICWAEYGCPADGVDWLGERP